MHTLQMACRAKAAHGIEHRIEHAEEHEAEVILFEQQALRAAGPLFGLLSIARRRTEIPTILKGLSGNEYPLVTDSPFGQLSIFRWGVAKWVPDLAPQVVLLVSPKQYDGDVADALRETGRIGKRYYLAYHGPSMPERAQPQLVVDGQTVQQYFHSTEEYTEIREFES